MNHPVVVLDDIVLHPDINWVYRRYRKAAEDGLIPKNLIRIQDYKRWSVVYSTIPDRVELLDVGIGAGQFVNAAGHSRRFKRVIGMDRTEVAGFTRLSKHFRFVLKSIVMPMQPKFQSDIVTCMECIEHLKSPGFSIALANLKFLTKQRLIVTVPYCEREPLPRYHFQRFDSERLATLFPGAEITLLAAGRVIKWALIDYRPQACATEGDLESTSEQ